MFWLPGCDLMKSASSYVTITDNFLDGVNGLCEEQELNKHLSPTSINGCMGWYSCYGCWLRSAYATGSGNVACLNDGYVDYFAYGNVGFGFSPACSIG